MQGRRVVVISGPSGGLGVTASLAHASVCTGLAGQTLQAPNALHHLLHWRTPSSQVIRDWRPQGKDLIPLLRLMQGGRLVQGTLEPREVWIATCTSVQQQNTPSLLGRPWVLGCCIGLRDRLEKDWFGLLTLCRHAAVRSH
jgi:hypothetical protein